MTTYGITDSGFVLKRLANIISDIKSGLSTISDPETGEPLTPDLLDEDDPLINIINSISDNLSELWEIAQESYNTCDPMKATGAGLSGVIQYNGLTRGAGSYSQAAVTIVGTPGLVIESGKQITTINDIPVFSLPEITLDDQGKALVIATCTVKGPFMAYSGELVKILTPVTGWTSVTNALDSVPGTYEESDTLARARQQISTSKPAESIAESIVAEMRTLTGCTFAKLYHNIELIEDENGIPAKSIAPVIVGGDDSEIAEILYRKIGIGGVQTFGSDSEIIYDANDVPYEMFFSRPFAIDITVDIEYDIVNSNVFPTNGEDLIKSAILLWAATGAMSIGTTSMTHAGYYPGQTVYASELYAPIYNSVSGINITSIEVSADGSSDPLKVEIAWNEIAVFDADDIIFNAE